MKHLGAQSSICDIDVLRHSNRWRVLAAWARLQGLGEGVCRASEQLGSNCDDEIAGMCNEPMGPADEHKYIFMRCPTTER